MEINITRQYFEHKPNRYQLLLSRLCFLASGLGFIFVMVNDRLRNRLPNWDLILVIVIYLLGWFIHEPDIPGIITNRLSNIFGISLLVSEIILLVLTISAVVHHSSYYLLPLVLFIPILIIIIRLYPKLRYIALILCMGIVLFSANINAWQTSYIRDEYPQFDLTLSIAKGTDFNTILGNLFNAKVYFVAIPMIATDIQVVLATLLIHTNISRKYVFLPSLNYHTS
jgi:hypothetical protein